MTETQQSGTNRHFEIALAFGLVGSFTLGAAALEFGGWAVVAMSALGSLSLIAVGEMVFWKDGDQNVA